MIVLSVVDKQSFADFPLKNVSVTISGYKTEPRGSLNVQTYNCCPEPYQDITFDILLRRKPGYYEYNIILSEYVRIYVILTTTKNPDNIVGQLGLDIFPNDF